MLFWIYILTILLLVVIALCVTFEHDRLFTKILCGIVVVTHVLVGSVLVFTFGKVLSEPNISSIEIEYVYKDSDNDKYFIKLKDKDLMTILTPNTVYKGDSNYIVRYEYPNMTDLSSFLFDTEKIEYDLVVTDTNIKDLPTYN